MLGIRWPCQTANVREFCRDIPWKTSIVTNQPSTIIYAHAQPLRRCPQNEGPAKNPLNWLICVEILSGISECLWVSTHPWKPLYRMEIVPGCPRHIMPRCKTCATHKTYFYTIKLDRLLILTKTFNGQEARSAILYQLPPNSLWSPKTVKFSMLPFPSKKEKICSSYPQHFPYANAPSLHPKSPHRRARLSTVRGSSFCSVRGVGNFPVMERSSNESKLRFMCAAEIDHWIYHQSIETFFAGWTNSAVTHDALKIGVGGWKKAGLVILFSGQNGKTICMFQKCLGRGVSRESSMLQMNQYRCTWCLFFHSSSHLSISPSTTSQKNHMFFSLRTEYQDCISYYTISHIVHPWHLQQQHHVHID